MDTWGRELTKIPRQIRGWENMFGYKSTEANQLYLLYCFSGKIYFTDKMPKQVKYLWYGALFCYILFTFVIGGMYLWYGGAEGDDFVVTLTVLNAVASNLGAAIAIPLTSFFCRKSIEKTIDQVDDILTARRVSDPNQKSALGDAKTRTEFLAIMGFYFACITINLSICFLDVALLFEGDKVKNYQYYALPVFMMRRYNSIGLYFIVNGISTMFFIMLAMYGWMPSFVITYWSMVWYNQLILLRDELDTDMSDLNSHFGGHCYRSNDWNEAFESILKRSIRKFQKITLLIDELRGFVEISGSLFVYIVYIFNLFCFYNTFSSDISAAVMVKNITASLSSAVAVFLFYWTGQNLENSVAEVSMAIYSTPWYQSAKVRKEVHIFLHQTQTVKNFTIFRVYSVLLNNFSRYVNGLVSYTRILLKLTK